MGAFTLLNLNYKSQHSMQVQITFEYVKSEIRNQKNGGGAVLDECKSPCLVIKL